MGVATPRVTVGGVGVGSILNGIMWCKKGQQYKQWEELEWHLRLTDMYVILSYLEVIFSPVMSLMPEL